MTAIPRGSGYSGMFKDGSRFLEGIEDVISRNIDACLILAKLTSTGYGPFGLSKFVVNHLDKLQVTNEASQILRESEVEHPAAKVVAKACEQMHNEVGDGTNFVVLFAASLLQRSRPNLLRMGVKPAQINAGYEAAYEKALELMDKMVVHEIKDLSKVDDVATVLKSVISTKQIGWVDVLSRLVARACVDASDARLNKNNTSSTFLDVDNVRIVKVLGGSVDQSFLVHGMVLKSDVEGSVKKLKADKTDGLNVAIYSCPVDIGVLETKGTVLMTNAEELLAFSHGEEANLFGKIKAIADKGINVIVSGTKFSEMAIHFCNQLGILTIKCVSKFDLRRMARLTRAFVNPNLVAPEPNEIGHCTKVHVSEIGRSTVTIVESGEAVEEYDDNQDGYFDRNRAKDVVSIVVRGSTNEILDDAERACSAAINSFKVLTKDQRLLPGAGAFEISLTNQLLRYAETVKNGMDQLIIQTFAESFDLLPRVLVDNAGFNGTEILAKLYNAHEQQLVEGAKTIVNAGIEFGDGSEKPRIVEVKDIKPYPVYDLLFVKKWAFKHAFQAASVVLSVDRLLVAKAAGGPKPRDNAGWDATD